MRPKRTAAGALSLWGIIFCAIVGLGGCVAPDSVATAPTTPDGSTSAHGASTEEPLSAADKSAVEVLEIVQERGERVERVDAALVLHLTRADGAQAKLDATLRMGRPDRFRMKSTKWGFLVCDVVVNGNDATAVLSSVVREQAMSSAEATVALAHVLGSLVGWHESIEASRIGESLRVIEEREHEIVVQVVSDDTQKTEWTLARSDGRPLRVRRIEGSETTGTLDCSAHVDVDGVPLPTRLRFTSAAGVIDVEVRKPRVNPSFETDPFVPPEGAIPLPTPASSALPA